MHGWVSRPRGRNLWRSESGISGWSSGSGTEMKNKLNVTGTRSILTTVDEYRAAVAEIATRAHRGLAIYTPDLEPQLYDHDLFLEPMKRLRRSRPPPRGRGPVSGPRRRVW